MTKSAAFCGVNSRSITGLRTGSLLMGPPVSRLKIEDPEAFGHRALENLGAEHRVRTGDLRLGKATSSHRTWRGAGPPSAGCEVFHSKLAVTAIRAQEIRAYGPQLETKRSAYL